jgi:transcriptional regulator with XRE-family HTH domain
LQEYPAILFLGYHNTSENVDICKLTNYDKYMDRNHLGGILKQQRISLSLTLQELASKAGVSASHLGRIERGERFPSAHILQRIAEPLAFEVDELFTLAGYLSPQSPLVTEKTQTLKSERLDPYVARVLAQEPVETQRAVIGILTILKSIAKSTGKENS